jgi:DNA-binding NarL/FixJ family response regulator
MAQRVEMFRGTLHAGPVADGGYRLSATLVIETSQGTRMAASVLICDDQELLRVGLRMIVDSQPRPQRGRRSSRRHRGDSASDRVTARLVLTDVRMSALDGVAATERNCAELPETRVLSSPDLDEYAYAALRARASGLLVKSR